MLGGFSSWIRRRLLGDPDDAEDDLDDEDDEERDHGSLVRKGELVTLRQHVPQNREAFQRWYADRDIAQLLRHDLEPLTPAQSRGYFETFILPSSARGTCFAIHERKSKRLVGTTALTDRIRVRDGASALFRIVIGEKDVWDKGYGTEATRLMAEEAFDSMGLSEIRLEVFNHNQRAIAAYSRVGFEVTGEHVEWVPRHKTELRVIEMRLSRHTFAANSGSEPGDARGNTMAEHDLEAQRRRRQLRRKFRTKRKAERAGLLDLTHRVPTTRKQLP
jgi:RimJ/RimL family protein N-acetyltransferase